MAESLRFDDLFRFVGGLGWFQVLQSVLLFLVGVFGPEPVYVNFVAAELPHWCSVPGLAGRVPFETQKIVAIPIDRGYLFAAGDKGVGVCFLKEIQGPFELGP